MKLQYLQLAALLASSAIASPLTHLEVSVVASEDTDTLLKESSGAHTPLRHNDVSIKDDDPRDFEFCLRLCIPPDIENPCREGLVKVVFGDCATCCKPKETTASLEKSSSAQIPLRHDAVSIKDEDEPPKHGPCLLICYPPDSDFRCPTDFDKVVEGGCGTCCLRLHTPSLKTITQDPKKHSSISIKDEDEPPKYGPCLAVCYPPDFDIRCPPNFDKVVEGGCGTCCLRLPTPSLKTITQDPKKRSSISIKAEYPICYLMCAPKKEYLDCPSDMEPFKRGENCWTCCSKTDSDQATTKKKSWFEL